MPKREKIKAVSKTDLSVNHNPKAGLAALIQPVHKNSMNVLPSIHSTDTAGSYFNECPFQVTEEKFNLEVLLRLSKEQWQQNPRPTSHHILPHLMSYLLLSSLWAGPLTEGRAKCNTSHLVSRTAEILTRASALLSQGIFKNSRAIQSSKTKAVCFFPAVVGGPVCSCHQSINERAQFKLLVLITHLFHYVDEAFQPKYITHVRSIMHSGIIPKTLECAVCEVNHAHIHLRLG